MVNPRPARSRTVTLARWMSALLALPALFLLAWPLAAQTPDCDRAGCEPIRVGSRVVCFTPATPAPPAFWGELQPADTGTLPAARDTTNFNENVETYWSRNWFFGVEIQNGYVLMGLAHGIGIWDARTDPANPAFVGSKLYAPGQSFPFIPSGESSKIVFTSISAPDDTVAAVAGNFAGLLVFDLSNKGMPRAVYQNADRSAQSVWTTKIGTTRYAFMPALGGVYVYNLEQALASNGCLQNAAFPNNCPGVMVKQMATAASGVIVHGDGNFLVSSFGPAGGFEIYNVSDPLNPQLRLSGLHDAATKRPVQGVALWHQGSSYYLVARLGLTLTIRQKETAIYDVSCIATGGSCTLGAPLWHQPLDTLSGNDLVTFSRSGTTPFLYVGGDAACLGSDGLQHEFLLDVTNPSNPRDITPTHVIPETANYNSVSTTVPVNYWSYYDRASPTGFNHVEPFAGKFNGQYFYRAGRSIFDIHRWVHDVAPTADFTWSPTQIYPGTPVTFTDTSANLPNSWTWTFQGGTPPGASGGAASSVVVSFGSSPTYPSSKSVTLTSQNSSGLSNPVTKSVVVLNPAPAVTGITVSPQNPSVCQPVTFTATGATGQPTLGYSWAVTPTPPAGSPASSTSTLVWADTSQVVPGTPYAAQVTVNNGLGTATSPAGTGGVTFQALQPLAFTGAAGAPENDPFTAATVQFHARTLGATSWSWDFGDGQGFRPYTNDPVSGPNPTFTYAAAGTYAVSVKIKNCVPANGEITSAPLSVHVTQTTPLIAAFQALFCGGICVGTTGQAITFIDSSTGADHWDYDWTHSTNSAATCNFTDSDHTVPVTSHTYTANGTYYPCLRVRRGASEQNVAVHLGISISGGGGNPSISITGNSAGSLDQAYTFTALATSCTPSLTGWSWTVGGGTGSSTSSSISVTWATTGTKTVSVTNSACGSATGLHPINITDPNGGGGGGLASKFTFTPSSPKPGDTVTFDGTASTGSPTSYIWTFGDGTQASTATATHAYAAAGSYQVQLAVGAPGTGCPVAPCIVQAMTSQTIVVQGPPPVVADYTTSGATCSNVGGFDFCSAQTLQAVTLTATTTDGSSYQWSFGDNTTGSGTSVTHAWSQAGSFQVMLTVTKGGASASKSRTFTVTGTTPPAVKEVVLPWIAQTRGALVQSSDLYVHNPSTKPMTVTLEFRKRGTPDVNPPQASKTIAPGATLFVADVLNELFNRQNIAGFVSMTVTQGDTFPVITSYNTTVQADGKQFGQTISGISMSPAAAAVGTGVGGTAQNLVGLISNSDRLAYFGVSNPGSTPATYHLRFFDKSGTLIGESSQDFTVSPFGQRQFQAGEIQSTFGISNQADYRVEVSTTTGGGALVPYASNLRLASNDPSFMEVGSAKNSKAYLLGVLSAPGTNNSLWQSDLLLSNIGTQASAADVTFTSIGLNAVPTSPLHVTLQPGQTQRLENVVAGQLGVQNGIGVLTVSGSSPEGIFPIVQGESYDNSVPTKRFGQSMAAMTDANAAVTGQSQYLAGLRQDTAHRTTLWLFNPGSLNAQYDILYRGLDGSLIGSTRGVILGAGKLRQFSPNQHPLPAGGVQDGFTVQIVVTSGKVLSAAQVVNNDTNDPSYIQGEAR